MQSASCFVFLSLVLFHDFLRDFKVSMLSLLPSMFFELHQCHFEFLASSMQNCQTVEKFWRPLLSITFGQYGFTLSLEHFSDMYSSLIKERNSFFNEDWNDAYSCVILKNHKLWSKKTFLKILSSLQWCSFEISRIIFIDVRKFCV